MAAKLAGFRGAVSVQKWIGCSTSKGAVKANLLVADMIKWSDAA
jgi:hypothetical protein